jgi:endoglucanase Acf2
MADTKISALTAASVAAVGNELAINEAGTSKKITIDQLKTLMQELGMPRVKRLGTQHSISSTTGDEVTGLTMALEAGTYVVQYNLIVRSATSTVGPMFGVNFDGTAAVKTFALMFPDGSTVLTAYTANMDDEGTKGLGVMSGMNTKTYSTTAPNLGTTVGVTTTASDIGCYILGTLIVTAAGNLELWHSSETASATSIEVGSSLVVIRTA